MEKYKKKRKTMSVQQNTKILAVSLFLLVIVNNGIGGLNDFVSSCMLNYLENKTLQVGYLEGRFDSSEVEKFIMQQEEVQAYFDYGQDYVGVSQVCLDGKKTGKGIDVEPYDAEVMKGYMTNYIEKLEDDEVIVGRYTNFSMTGIVDVDTDTEIIDMEPYIGKTLTCKIIRTNPEKEKEYSFRIVGVFDNIKAGKPGVFYINDKVRHDMLDLLDYHISAIDEEGNEERSRMIYFQVITEDKADIDMLRHKIYQKFPGIHVLHPVNYPDIVVYFLTGLILVGDFIIFFFVFNNISSVIYVTEDNIYKRRREFGTLKAIGYRDKDLRNLLWKESLVSSLKAVALSSFAGLIVFGVSRWFVLNRMNLYFTELRFSVKPHTFLLYFLTAFGVPMIGFWYGYRHLRNLVVIEALRAE